ncbi:MAG: NADH-quinone oxidoreductase subunit I, partial [Gammaproteobacteria bacterium SHHR-1]
YCGFCEESCPVDSIVLSRIYEYSMEQNSERVIDKQRLLAIGEQYEAQLAADRAEQAKYR